MYSRQEKKQYSTANTVTATGAHAIAKRYSDKILQYCRRRRYDGYGAVLRTAADDPLIPRAGRYNHATTRCTSAHPVTQFWRERHTPEHRSAAVLYCIAASDGGAGTRRDGRQPNKHAARSAAGDETPQPPPPPPHHSRRPTPNE